jgi:hypothetical protein
MGRRVETLPEAGRMPLSCSSAVNGKPAPLVKREARASAVMEALYAGDHDAGCAEDGRNGLRHEIGFEASAGFVGTGHRLKARLQEVWGGKG